MLYNEIVDKVKKICEPVDVKDIKEHFAYQFNVSGEGEGAFYLDINEGKVSVMPYEYFDRNVLFFVPTEILLNIFEGKTALDRAIEAGLVAIEGEEKDTEALKLLIDRVNGKKTMNPAEESVEKAPAAEKIAEKAEDAADKASEKSENVADKASEKAEKAAEKAEDAAEKTTENAEDVADKATEKAENAEDAAGKTAEKAEDAAEKATERAEDVADKTTEKVEDTAEKAEKEAADVAVDMGKKKAGSKGLKGAGAGGKGLSRSDRRKISKKKGKGKR